MCFFAMCVGIACWQFSVGRVLTGAVLESYALAEFSVGRVPVLAEIPVLSVCLQSSSVAEFQCWQSFDSHSRFPVFAE